MNDAELRRYTPCDWRLADLELEPEDEAYHSSLLPPLRYLLLLNLIARCSNLIARCSLCASRVSSSVESSKLRPSPRKCSPRRRQLDLLAPTSSEHAGDVFQVDCHAAMRFDAIHEQGECCEREQDHMLRPACQPTDTTVRFVRQSLMIIVFITVQEIKTGREAERADFGADGQDDDNGEGCYAPRIKSDLQHLNQAHVSPATPSAIVKPTMDGSLRRSQRIVTKPLSEDFLYSMSDRKLFADCGSRVRNPAPLSQFAAGRGQRERPPSFKSTPWVPISYRCDCIIHLERVAVPFWYAKRAPYTDMFLLKAVPRVQHLLRQPASAGRAPHQFKRSQTAGDRRSLR